MRYKWLCAQRFLGFISSIPCKWELPRGKNKSWASSKACFATSLSNELILTAVAPCFSYKIQLGLHQQPPWTHPRTSGCRLNDAILRKGRWCCRCCRCCRWRSKLGQPWFVGQSGMSHVSSCQKCKITSILILILLSFLIPSLPGLSATSTWASATALDDSPFKWLVSAGWPWPPTTKFGAFFTRRFSRGFSKPIQRWSCAIYFHILWSQS